MLSSATWKINYWLFFSHFSETSFHKKAKFANIHFRIQKNTANYSLFSGALETLAQLAIVFDCRSLWVHFKRKILYLFLFISLLLIEKDLVKTTDWHFHNFTFHVYFCPDIIAIGDLQRRKLIVGSAKNAFILVTERIYCGTKNLL